MNYFYAFIICGGICTIGQIIYDNTKFTPGHITSLFVVIGVFLDGFHIYDKIVDLSLAGASLPILSFGHSLSHAAIMRAYDIGLLGIPIGMFDKTSSGIATSIFLALVVALLFKPKS